ncbi:MAG: energy-coupling factor transporter transmembrane component T family protein [Thermoprotei archaeon]
MAGLIGARSGVRVRRVRTIAGYVDSTSVLLSLNPVTKLLLLLFAALYTVLGNLLEVNLLAVLTVLAFLKTSGIKLSAATTYLRVLLGFLLIIILSYFLASGNLGRNLLVCVGSLRLYVENLVTGLTIYTKILATVLIVILVLSITTVRDFINGLSSLGLSLRAALIIGLVFKFMYYLQVKLEEIKLGELSRGLEVSKSNFFKSISLFFHRLLPLFSITLTKIDEVSDVLELRGFNLTEERKSLLSKPTFGFIDLLVLSLIVLVTSLLTYFSLVGVLNPLNSLAYRLLISYSVFSGCHAR